jgi:hypothetical protein
MMRESRRSADAARRQRGSGDILSAGSQRPARQNGDPAHVARPQGTSRVLRPGVAIPLLSNSAAMACIAGAAILAVVAPAGGRHQFPLAGDWSALPSRLIAAEVLATCAWAFCKLGTSRIVLRETSMEIVTWMLRWTIGRGDVADVAAEPSALAIYLADGCVIRPSTFWSTPSGVIYFRLGMFKNSMFRLTIRDAILAWRRPPAQTAPKARRIWPCRRHWRPRLNVLLLLLLLGVFAAEATLVTAFA